MNIGSFQTDARDYMQDKVSKKSSPKEMLREMSRKERVKEKAAEAKEKEKEKKAEKKAEHAHHKELLPQGQGFLPKGQEFLPQDQEEFHPFDGQPTAQPTRPTTLVERMAANIRSSNGRRLLVRHAPTRHIPLICVDSICASLEVSHTSRRYKCIFYH